MKTSLGIWALGSMVTRFVPGGYQPQWAGETTAERVRRAIDGLGDLIDGYEFHYPQELDESKRSATRSEITTSTASRAGSTSIHASAAAGCATPIRQSGPRRCGSRWPGRTSRASSACP